MSESSWQASSSASYYVHFSQQRPKPPVDTSPSYTLSQQSCSSEADPTTRVYWKDFRSLSHKLSERAILDLDFVDNVVSSNGPILVKLSQKICWQWDDKPSYIPAEATAEHDYYQWLEWVVFGPAAHAVAAVRDLLHRQAEMNVSPGLRGDSTTKSVFAPGDRGTADILAVLREPDAPESIFTAHEMKRSRVLLVGDEDVLENLVRLAKNQDGWVFRSPKSTTLEEKARRLLFQVIISISR